MWRSVLSKKMGVCLSTGFSSGLPLYFLYQTLPVWFRDNQMDLKSIAAFALVSNPYTLKFLWAPVFDHFALPFGGRRRGWTFVIQLLLVVSFALFAFLNPKEDIWLLGGLSFIVAFLSACQDIVLDAYRREILDDEELGLGSSLFTNAYRFSSLVPGSLALILADSQPWAVVHLMIACFMGFGLLSTWWMDEPEVSVAPRSGFRAAVVEPFLEFFRRDGVRSASILLAFMLLYKLGDSMATALASPFYLDLGFSKSQIGSVVKVASLWSTIVGSLIGGLVMLRIGIGRALWVFGVVQVISILGFYVLADHSHTLSIEQVRNVERFANMAAFESRTQMPGGVAQALGDFVYVRPDNDLRCVQSEVTCLSNDERRTVYVNELDEAALAMCRDDAGGCFTKTEVERLVAARLQGVYPTDSNQLKGIIGGGVEQPEIHLVFKVRLAYVSIDWFEAFAGVSLNESERKALTQSLDNRHALSNHQSLLALAKLSPSRHQQFRAVLEVRSDVNTATLNELGSRPPVQPDPWLLFWVVSFEYLGVGLGTAAFVAFISSITNRQHTATQFALLTSVAAVPRTFVNASTGVLIQSLGYSHFFLLCTILALPGMILLWWVAPLRRSAQS
jgi:MFS transporter, PAT family, beta-lactamase induction signal transducer AmpG